MGRAALDVDARAGRARPRLDGPVRRDPRRRRDARRRAPRGPPAHDRRGRRDRPPDRADADGRPGPRRAGAAGRLERARRRHLARHLRPARRARPVPGPRRLGAHGDPARRLRARAARRAAGVLAAPLQARVPRRRAAGADRALRRAGRRAGLHGRVPARRGVHAPDGRVPAPGEAAPAGFDRGDRTRRRRDAGRARRGAAAQPRHALVRLRDVGGRDLVEQVDLVHVGRPELRRAQLAARRPRADPRQGQDARLLEDPEPRRLRRPRLEAHAGALRGQRTAARQRAGDQALDAADQGLGPQPAQRPVRHGRLRDGHRDPATVDGPDLGRAVCAVAHAAPRRRVHRDGLYAQADRGPAPARGCRLHPRPGQLHGGRHPTPRRARRRAADVPVLRGRRWRDPHGRRARRHARRTRSRAPA